MSDFRGKISLKDQNEMISKTQKTRNNTRVDAMLDTKPSLSHTHARVHTYTIVIRKSLTSTFIQHTCKWEKNLMSPSSRNAIS